MYLKKIFLKNFRNYALQEVDFCPGVNIFWGENAQGKTNLLEAIYLLGLGKSYRTIRDQELIKWQEDFFFLKGLLEKEQRNITLEISLKNLGKKQVKINGQEERKLGALLGIMKLVVFSPADLQLVQGAPSERRKFLDGEISQISPLYYHDCQQYYRILQQRNNQLKRLREHRKEIDFLTILDEKLLLLGSKIIKKRLVCLKKISLLAKLIHRKITAQEENLELHYVSCLGPVEEKTEEEIASMFKNALEIGRKQELERGSTLQGPHRDDFTVFINGYQVKNYGSQGQQRTAVLALKLAELEFMKSEGGEYPLLLLDDVMSELDQERRELLVSVVKNKIQTFITTTDLKAFSSSFLQEASLKEVQKGYLVR